MDLGPAVVVVVEMDVAGDRVEDSRPLGRFRNSGVMMGYGWIRTCYSPKDRK